MNNPTSTSLNPYHAYQYIGQLQAGVNEKDNLIDLMSERLLKVGSGGGGIIVILLLCCCCCFILIPVIFIFLVREEIIEMPDFIPDSVIKILCDNSLIEIDSVCSGLGSQEEEVTTESECSDHGNDRAACESNDCYYNTVQTVCQDEFSCSALGETACNTDERCLWSSEIKVCGNKLSCDSLNMNDCMNTRDDCIWGSKSQAEPSVAACKVKTSCDTYSSQRLCDETYHCVWSEGSSVCQDRQDCSSYTDRETEAYCSGESKKANTCVYLADTDTCVEAGCDSALLDNADKCIGSSTAEQACQWVIAGNAGACQDASEGGD